MEPNAQGRHSYKKIGRERLGPSTSFRSAYAYASFHRLADYLQTDICRKQVRCNGKTVWSGSDDDGFDHRHQSGLSCLNGP